MPNLYLFRNALNHRVLISPFFRMDNAVLAQLREHRPQNKIRPDHWVPFVVLSGLKQLDTAHTLVNALATCHSIKGPGSKEIYPLKTQHEIKWEIPVDIKEKTIALCRALNNESYFELEKSSRLASISDPAEKESLQAMTPTQVLTEQGDVTLWWERDDYKYVIESDPSGLLWPEYIQHKPLELKRSRFPVVPEFDFKTVSDTYHQGLSEQLAKPRRKDKYQGWQPIPFAKLRAQQAATTKSAPAQ